ncbi:MAG TPA: hypothetical protein VGC16_00385 [Rhizomicrobium sp.]
MAADRTFRSLTALKGASTSRVLNLLAIGQLHAENTAFLQNPFFSSPVLNNAILVKHRLRADEVDLFMTPRTIATKVIVPFEKSDLRSGGKSFMVGQRGYEDLLRDVGNYGENRTMDRDLKILHLIDAIPSLDPFLLREHLRCHEISPDTHYFEISDADQRRMFDYAASQIRRLTEMAGGGRSGQGDATARMVGALLSSEVDEKLEPLRITLQLNEAEFREGVFSWRGFLYYKWSLLEFWPSLIKSLRQLKTISHVGSADSEQKAYMTSARETIIRGAKHGSDDIKNILAIYDGAYESLIADRDAKKFRDFLLNAPALFLEIGEKMGTLSHLTSFWKYRFPDGAPRTVDADELTAIFQDFSKGFTPSTKLAA